MTKEWKGEDIAAVGKAMYEEIQGQFEETYKGKIVVIDVKSGDYEIGDNDLDTTLRMFERRPNALTWGERVGYPAIYEMGGRCFPPVDLEMLEKLRAEFGETEYRDKECAHGLDS